MLRPVWGDGALLRETTFAGVRRRAGAIDLGRAYSAKTSMQGALDAALLAAASKRAQFVKHTYLSR